MPLSTSTETDQRAHGHELSHPAYACWNSEQLSSECWLLRKQKIRSLPTTFCKWPAWLQSTNPQCWPSAHVSTRMHGCPFAELACPLPAADLQQYNAKLSPSSQLCCCPRAARQDNGHIVSMAASLALALRAGRSILAVAGVFGAGKIRSLTFLLAWLALTTHLKIAVVHEENPAGWTITELLTAFDLEPDHQDISFDQ